MAALGAANKASKVSTAPANIVVAGAKSQMVSKYGIGAYVRPKMWYLSLLKASFSQPLLTGIIVIVAMLSLWIYLFGWISLWYALYMLKAEVAVILNVILSVCNTIWFAFHAFTQILLLAFLDVINGIAHFFIEPIAQAVMNILGFLNIDDLLMGTGIKPGEPLIQSLGLGANISFQPEQGFAYYLPASVLGANAFGFVAVMPGSEIYITDAQGDIVYDYDFDQNGVKLMMPRVNPYAETDDFWCSISDRWKGDPYNPAIPFEIHAWGGTTLLKMITDAIGEAIDDVKNWFLGFFFEDETEVTMDYKKAWGYWHEEVKERLSWWDWWWASTSYSYGNFLKYNGGFWEYVFNEVFWENRDTNALLAGKTKWSDVTVSEGKPIIDSWLNNNKHIWHPSHWGNRW